MFRLSPLQIKFPTKSQVLGDHIQATTKQQRNSLIKTSALSSSGCSVILTRSFVVVVLWVCWLADWLGVFFVGFVGAGGRCLFGFVCYELFGFFFIPPHDYCINNLCQDWFALC